MMHNVSVEEAQRTLLQLLQHVLQGEEVVIVDGGQPIARLIPVVREDTPPTFGSARGLITVADDFDEPLEEFEEHDSTST